MSTEGRKEGQTKHFIYTDFQLQNQAPYFHVHDFGVMASGKTLFSKSNQNYLVDVFFAQIVLNGIDKIIVNQNIMFSVVCFT